MYTEIMSTTIRVSEATRDRFAALAKSTGKPMTDLLDQAVTTLEQRYESLRGSDDGAWAEISVERSLEASALHDSSR
jgi:predicted transcriptional regulator